MYDRGAGSGVKGQQLFASSWHQPATGMVARWWLLQELADRDEAPQLLLPWLSGQQERAVHMVVPPTRDSKLSK